MQQPHCQLKEIIWEITDNCNAGCAYCGSKDILNKTTIDEDKIQDIVNAIYEYPPDEINISGGNPLLVPYDSHKCLVNKFHLKNIVTKILINPFNTLNISDAYDILELYDWIGLSINTLNELEHLTSNLTLTNVLKKSTIITNFNKVNIFDFNTIRQFVDVHNLQWQIQFTMYEDDQSQAIYSSVESMDLFFKKVKEAMAEGCKIILADNCNYGKCSAGSNSLGILANGDVIPCLSMRSWDKNKCKNLVMGNLLEDELVDIWSMGFGYWRCGTFDCCKDVTGIIEYGSSTKEEEPIQEEEILPQPPATFLYGVRTLPEIKPYPYDPNITMVYGIRTEPIQDPWKISSVEAYAVMNRDYK